MKFIVLFFFLFRKLSLRLDNFSFLSDFAPRPFSFFNPQDVSLFADRKRLEILKEFGVFEKNKIF